MTSILIGDDHEMIRAGLRLIVTQQPGLHIAAEAASGAEVLEKYAENTPDLVILDISMPDINGMDVADKILADHPDASIIVLSMFNDEEYISRCIESGVKGYVIKNEASTELLHAINTVVEGNTYFSKQAQSIIFQKYSNRVIKKKKEADYKLTTREIEIGRLISEGLTSAMIAEKLFISPRTVDTHRANLIKKLNVRNSIELLKKMEQLGVL